MTTWVNGSCALPGCDGHALNRISTHAYSARCQDHPDIVSPTRCRCGVDHGSTYVQHGQWCVDQALREVARDVTREVLGDDG